MRAFCLAVAIGAAVTGCKSKSDNKKSEPEPAGAVASAHTAERCDEVWQVVETKKDFEKFARYAETFAARPEDWPKTCQRLTEAELECIENIDLLANIARSCSTSRAKLFRKPRPGSQQ